MESNELPLNENNSNKDSMISQGAEAVSYIF